MQTNRPTIRYAVPSDADALSTLSAKTFRDTYAAYNTEENMAMHIEATFAPRQLRAEIESTSGFILVAEDGNELVAYAAVTREIVPPAVGDDHALELKRFYVDRAWHGLGVAQRLMAETCNAARERGAATIWLTVWDQNPRAITFYRKVGFTDAGRIAFQLGNEEQTDILMVKSL
ncbi:MAG TPA: GNAT family N-acetyltransferase [Gemmatimonadaceae bacterium]|nr:GNAT family N-acetyltransferase [Gemmatimonadaceae bacterium]